MRRVLAWGLAGRGEGGGSRSAGWLWVGGGEDKGKRGGGRKNRIFEPNL